MAMADGPVPQEQASTDRQQIASASILLQIVMLGLSFVLGHVLRRHKIYYINEASASLLLGKGCCSLLLGFLFLLCVCVCVFVCDIYAHKAACCSSSSSYVHLGTSKRTGRT